MKHVTHLMSHRLERRRVSPTSYSTLTMTTSNHSDSRKSTIVIYYLFDSFKKPFQISKTNCKMSSTSHKLIFQQRSTKPHYRIATSVAFFFIWMTEIKAFATKCSGTVQDLSLTWERNIRLYQSSVPQVDAGQYWRDFDTSLVPESSLRKVEENSDLQHDASYLSKRIRVRPAALGEQWVDAKRKSHLNIYKRVQAPITLRTFPSTQEQLPALERIAKAIHEESLPWTLSVVIASITTYIVQSSVPFYIYVALELSFLIKCTLKYLYRFNVPVIPEPLVGDRDWKGLVKNIWSSTPNIDSSRSFLMGYFYDAPFHSLRREDAFNFLAWMRYGLPAEGGYLTTEETEHIINFDLLELERNVNNGEMLPLRMAGENPLPCMRFNIEPLRYRHKPIIFYAVTHGVFHILQRALKSHKFAYVKAKDSKNLSYWYRSSQDSSRSKAPLVFVHGCGGMAFYYNLIRDLIQSVNDNDVPIILLELPHISLRICDSIPDIRDQIDSLCTIMDSVSGKISKATFVGHSFGSVVLSWMIQSKPERVGSCVFIDPICFQLHLNHVLFNFHMQRVDRRLQEGKRWGNPFSIGALINLAGTEMHTNNAMLRKFSWATNILFPEDIVKREIPTKVLLSELDEIVPSSAIERTFRSKQKQIMGRKILDCEVVKGARHGDMVLNPELTSITIATVIQMMQHATTVELGSNSASWTANAANLHKDLHKDLRLGASAADRYLSHIN